MEYEKQSHGETKCEEDEEFVTIGREEDKKNLQEGEAGAM